MIMAGPMFGLSQFKMQKGSLANQILAVSRPQTQQSRGGNTRDELKKVREDEIKALYAQQLIVLAPVSSGNRANPITLLGNSKLRQC